MFGVCPDSELSGSDVPAVLSASVAVAIPVQHTPPHSHVTQLPRHASLEGILFKRGVCLSAHCDRCAPVAGSHSCDHCTDFIIFAPFHLTMSILGRNLVRSPPPFDENSLPPATAHLQLPQTPVPRVQTPDQVDRHFDDWTVRTVAVPTATNTSAAPTPELEPIQLPPILKQDSDPFATPPTTLLTPINPDSHSAETSTNPILSGMLAPRAPPLTPGSPPPKAHGANSEFDFESVLNVDLQGNAKKAESFAVPTDTYPVPTITATAATTGPASVGHSNGPVNIANDLQAVYSILVDMHARSHAHHDTQMQANINIAHRIDALAAIVTLQPGPSSPPGAVDMRIAPLVADVRDARDQLLAILGRLEATNGGRYGWGSSNHGHGYDFEHVQTSFERLTFENHRLQAQYESLRLDYDDLQHEYDAFKVAQRQNIISPVSVGGELHGEALTSRNR